MPSVLFQGFTIVIRPVIFGNTPSHGIEIEDSFPLSRGFSLLNRKILSKSISPLASLLTHLNYIT
jgi:hypothetical protein